MMKRRLRLSAAVAWALVGRGVSEASPASAEPPPHGAPAAPFAVDTSADAAFGKAATPSAAVVDGHAIPLASVIAICLRRNRAHIVDLMVQNYVVDRECQRRGIVVREDAISARVADLRSAVAPQTLELVVMARRSTMEKVRAAFRREIARVQLVANQVPPPRMARCRAIVIPYCPPGVPESVAGVKRTEAQASAEIKTMQTRIREGADFSVFAARYPQPGNGNSRGDLGVLYPGKRDTDPALIDAALAPGGGGTPVPVKTGNTYCLLQTVSTRATHPKNEDAAYAAALSRYVEAQAQFLAPKFVIDLIGKSHITFATDAELNPMDGASPAHAAAVVDGHPIPANEVVAACLTESGRRVTDILVQNFVVDQECERRGIRVSPAEIDRRVDNLKRVLAPHTIEEGLQSRHMTLTALRSDFKQDIERVRLVEDGVKPVKMTHCRLILIPFHPSGESVSTRGAARTEAEAGKAIGDIQRLVKDGKDFGLLAAEYAATDDSARGDAGVLYPGMHDIDTAVLEAGLSLGKGQVYPDPIRTSEAYCLVQAVSTSADHGPDEDAVYAEAGNQYKEQQAQTLIPAAILELLKKSKVVYVIQP